MLQEAGLQRSYVITIQSRNVLVQGSVIAVVRQCEASSGRIEFGSVLDQGGLIVRGFVAEGGCVL